MLRENIRNLIHSYFGFNRQQRNGLAVLTGICFFLLVIRIVYPHFIKPSNILVADLALIHHDAASLEKKTEITEKLFMFDPNLVNEEQLLNLGFSKRTASTFLKFRSKGFVFRKKDDLKKVYGITDKLYSRIEAYIIIGAARKTKSNATIAKLKSRAKVELNSADSLQLLDINGVGPSFAKRILKYRSILGGYVNVSQLKEVYGFTEEMFIQIEPQVTVDASRVTKININKDDFKSVNKHPYITYELTKMIFEKKRRELITPEVLQSLVNDEALYKKLEPYINF